MVSTKSNKQTAIVTGAYGYIGSVLTKILKESNYYVVGVDCNLDFFNDKSRVKFCDEFICDDFVSPRAIDSIDDYPEATIFHLAAHSLLGPSAFFPLSYYENNTFKTLKLIQNLKPSQKLVFASTAAVYAKTYKNVTENSKINPPNNYGLSKLWCEQIIDSCYESKLLKAVSFRFFNVIGAYGETGQLPNTPHIVNALCDTAKNGEIFVINGDNYKTRDGTCIRDYLHVVDVCRALVHAAKYLSDKDPCHLKFNLGTQTGTSVKEIVEIFNQNCSKIQFEIGSRRKGDPPFLVANPNKFIELTNFQYQYKNSDIDLMIKSAWEYRNVV